MRALAVSLRPSWRGDHRALILRRVQRRDQGRYGRGLADRQDELDGQVRRGQL